MSDHVPIPSRARVHRVPANSAKGRWAVLYISMFLALALFGVLDAETLHVVPWARETIETIGAAGVILVLAAWVRWNRATVDDGASEADENPRREERGSSDDGPPPFA